MPKCTVHALKETGYWYIDDDNGFSKADNQLVAGIPEIIELLAGTSTSRVSIEYADESFSGSICLTLISTTSSGSTYRGTINGKVMEGWLCPVFFYYFKKAPEKLYVRIKNLS